MKYVRQFEGWKSSDYYEIDKSNVEEIIYLLKDMQDELDHFEYEIEIDQHLNECYNIKYRMNNGLGFSNNSEGSIIDDKIKEDVKNLENLNKYVLKSHDLLRRLSSMGYSIAYFSNNHEFTSRGVKVISSDIRISMK